MSRVVNVLASPPSVRPADPTRRFQPIALVGVLAAVQAAALGLLVVTLVVLLGWASATYPGGSAADALRASVYGWLLAHHTDFAVPGGMVTIAPLGLLLLPGGLLVLAGTLAARSAGVDGVRGAALLTLAISAPYAGLAAGVAAGLPEGPSRWQAGVYALVIAAVASGLAITRQAGLGGRLLGRLPVTARAVLAGAGAGVLTLLGSGALLVGLALLWHHQRQVDLIGALAPGAVGGALLTLLGVLLLPNAAVWGAAYVVGPGFAVGAGTAVAPGGVALGAVPALPLLAALPGAGPGSVATYTALVVPVLAGTVIAVTVEARLTADSATARGSRTTVSCAAGGALLAGALLGALAWSSGGALGGGRMVALGPSWWRIALVGILVLTPVAALTVLGRRRWAARSSISRHPD